MISGAELTIEIGSRTLLDNGSFLVATGEKVGLVGRNGTGKSTLLSVLLEQADPEVHHHGELKIMGQVGFLPQVPVPQGLGTEPMGLSHVLSARGLDRLDDELGHARRALSEDPSEQNIERFTQIEEEYRNAGGYDAEAVIARMADGIGLRQDLLLDDIDGLSGGQRRRVDIIRLLFQNPEIMILDEPTNHLDLPAKRWLMDELQGFSGTILVISHDLDLLDKAITKVLHLSNKKLTEYKGNYTSFQQRLEGDIVQQEKRAAAEEKEIKRLSDLANSMRGQTEKRAKTAKSLDRRAARIQENRTEVTKREKVVRFKLPTPERSGTTPLEIRGLGVSYGDKQVLHRVSMGIGRGDRIAVVGRNGAGKSSLLRCIAGVQNPTKGSIELGNNVTLGYFAQEHEQIDLDRSSLDNIDD